MKGILILGLSFFFVTAKAQWSFEKVYPLSGQSLGGKIIRTSNGDFVISGRTFSSQINFSEPYLLRIDTAGNLKWAKTFSGTGSFGAGTVVETRDSGFAVIGIGQYTLGNNVKMFLIRTDKNGDTLWTKSYGGGLTNYIVDLIQTSDGGFVMTGYTNSYLPSGFNMYVIKIDSIGSYVWKRTFGGHSSDFGTAVKETADHGFIVTGNTGSFSCWITDAYLVKLNSSGNLQWSKTFCVAGSCSASDVLETTDSGYVLIGNCGLYQSNDDDIFMIRTNSIGDTIWTKTFGGVNYDDGYQIKVTPDSGYVVVGYSSSFDTSGTPFCFKTDFEGNLQWSKIAFEGQGSSYSSLVISDSAIYVSGTRNNLGLSSVSFSRIGLNGYGCNLIPIQTPEKHYTLQVHSPGTLVGTGGTYYSHPFQTISGTSVVEICDIVGIPSYPHSLNYFFQIDPNPASTTFTINSSLIENENGTIEIIDVLGRNVFTGIARVKAEYNIASLTAGVYFVQLKTREGTAVSKLVISH